MTPGFPSKASTRSACSASIRAHSARIIKVIVQGPRKWSILLHNFFHFPCARGWAIRCFVAQDWRDERIAELESALAASAADLTVERERVAQLEQQVATLGARVAELLSKLGQNSRNSHLPPSTDPPGAREQRRGKGKGASASAAVNRAIEELTASYCRPSRSTPS